MGQYTVISDISEEIVRVMQKELAPELVADESTVGLCSPEDQDNMTFGIYLYDIQENDEIRRSQMINVSEDKQSYPPVFFSLYYMMTAYSQSDKKFKMVQEQRMLGRAARYFHDYPYLEIGGEYIPIQLQKISTEDKIKLWNFNGKPFQVSLFYKVAPVKLDSGRLREVTRVRQRDIHMNQENGSRRR